MESNDFDDMYKKFGFYGGRKYITKKYRKYHSPSSNEARHYYFSTRTKPKYNIECPQSKYDYVMKEAILNKKRHELGLTGYNFKVNGS